MKKFIVVFLTWMFIANTAVLASEPKDQPPLPTVNATSAILLDYRTGKVLWEKNANEPMAMASTTKIMTAIVTLENANLEDTVVVSKKAAAAPKVKMNLKAGEEIKLKYLLYALMLESSNDAAVAIAEHVGGSVESFCAMMTEKAKSIGAKDTVFETPNGLDAGDHHATAYDMAVIARYALDNKEFMKIINSPTATFKSNTTSYSFVNKNRLLRELPGANGMKTGFTNKAGHCFVGTAKRGDMQLISVVLASGWGDQGREQKWRDTKEILNYGFQVFQYRDLVEPHQIASEVQVGRSKVPSINLYFKEGLTLPLSEQEFASVKVDIEAPQEVVAPVVKDAPVGVAKVYIGDTLYTEIPLCADAFATRHDMKTSIEKVLNGWFSMGTSNQVEVVLPELPMYLDF